MAVDTVFPARKPALYQIHLIWSLTLRYLTEMLSESAIRKCAGLARLAGLCQIQCTFEELESLRGARACSGLWPPHGLPWIRACYFWAARPPNKA